MNISDPSFQIAAQLMLPDDEVHLWGVDIGRLAGSLGRWQQLLSSDEQARARRFLVQRPREQFVITRGFLRTILAAYVPADPAKLVFRYSANSKPALSPPYDKSGVTFNVSHTSGVALLAFTRNRELGVDVEFINRQLDVDAIARQFFSRHEQTQLAAGNAEEKHAAFFRCWTRKEAYIKAKGEGLSLPLDQFDVSLVPGETKALISTRPDGSEAARWSLREVPAGPGYVGALCVAGHHWRLKSWQGESS